MSNIDKQALRGQSVEGSFYLVECCNCGEMYPSNLLDGGEAIADSGDYGDCYCHLCGADDTERADWGDVNSNEAKAWNFQQKRIEALLDELEAKDRKLIEILTPNMLLPVIDDMDEDNLRHVIKTVCENYSLLHAKWEAAGDRAEAAEKRIADHRETLLAARSHVMQCARLGDAHANGVLQAIDRAAAGKGDAS
jgi:hypothetical protein